MGHALASCFPRLRMARGFARESAHDVGYLNSPAFENEGLRADLFRLVRRRPFA